jgi:hypothetical protein
MRSCNELAGHGGEHHLAMLTMPIFSDSIGTTSTSIPTIAVLALGMETKRNAFSKVLPRTL